MRRVQTSLGDCGVLTMSRARYLNIIRAITRITFITAECIARRYAHQQYNTRNSNYPKHLHKMMQEKYIRHLKKMTI